MKYLPGEGITTTRYWRNVSPWIVDHLGNFAFCAIFLRSSFIDVSICSAVLGAKTHVNSKYFMLGDILDPCHNSSIAKHSGICQIILETPNINSNT